MANWEAATETHT